MTIIETRKFELSISPLQLVEHHFVDITPAPLFAGLERLDYRMPGGVKMFGGVLVF